MIKRAFRRFSARDPFDFAPKYTNYTTPPDKVPVEQLDLINKLPEYSEALKYYELSNYKMAEFKLAQSVSVLKSAK